MERVLLILVIGAVAAAVAALYQRWQADPQPTETGHVPTHLTRADFVGADSPWLVAVFSSATCLACASVWSAVKAFESATVAVQDIEVTVDKALHSKYRIDSVPTTVVVDSNGIVRHSFLGPLSPGDKQTLAAAIA